MKADTISFAADDWRAGIYAALKKQGVQQMAYVPDAGHASLINACHADSDISCTVLTTEEEGVALPVGQPCMRYCIVLVDLQRLLKAFGGLVYRVRCPLLPMKSSSQIMIVGVNVLRISLDQLFLWLSAKRHLQRVDDRPGQLVLYGKNILHVTVEAI